MEFSEWAKTQKKDILGKKLKYCRSDVERKFWLNKFEENEKYKTSKNNKFFIISLFMYANDKSKISFSVVSCKLADFIFKGIKLR